MKHLCRDFQTMPSASSPGTNMYALAAFMVHCGGFNPTGQTNFDVITSSVRLATGISASIAVGGVYEVFIPTGSYLVSSADVNRILALRSNLYPRHNSGLFRVTNFDSVANTLTVDYRSAAPAPTERFLAWSLFENELTVSRSWRSGSNGASGYGSWNAASGSAATASRIMLRSPDPSSWQVRMCLESPRDISGSVPSGFSIAPGFGGNADADFFAIDHDAGPGHDQRLFLHGAAWYNTTSSLYRGMTVGLTPALTTSAGGLYWTNGRWRISMMVDDASGTCGIVNHNVSLLGSGSGWCVFGLTADETETPGQNNLSDPSINVQRLFVAGSSNPTANLTWNSQFHSDNNMQVVGWSKFGYPVPGVLSSYSDVSNPSNSHVRYASGSSNTPWMNATELMDVDVLIGTIEQTLSAQTTGSLFPVSPRRVGRVPMFWQGRANFPQWTATIDSSSSYYHTSDGVFMEWGGPVPTDNGVGTAFTVASSSFGLQEGMFSSAASLPGSDPVPVTRSPIVTDVDATRLRKTYSYFRQVPVNVNVVKGGSNPAKP